MIKFFHIIIFSILFIGISEKLYAQDVPIYSYKVIKAYPHDTKAFTQGLFFKNDELYESTGQYGTSSIRKVDLETGKVIKKLDLPDHLFGEGIVYWEDDLIGITWKSQKGFVWDINTFKEKGQFSYKGEGWGLTHDGKSLIMSNGTSILQFLDPKTKEVTRRINVSYNGKPMPYLNELEWVNGEIFANIWQNDFIARINPKNGQIIGWIDLRGLLTSQGDIEGIPDVLNGIAVNSDGRLFLTGKLWPYLFEIELIRSFN